MAKSEDVIPMTVKEAVKFLRRKHKNPGQLLRDTIKKHGFVAGIGCHEAMSAKLVREEYELCLDEGVAPFYNIAYGSGWGSSVMKSGYPDLGLHSREEIAATARALVRQAYPLLLMMDMETGFGPTLSIPLLFELLDELGVALGHLEDQYDAERSCGHGAKLIAGLERMIMRLKTFIIAREARQSDMLLMARTDAWDAANGSPEEAMRRAEAFAKLEVEDCANGRVDVIWSEFSTADPGLAREFAQTVHNVRKDVMLGLNFSPNMDQPAYFRKHQITPPLLETYANMGYQVMFHTVLSAKASMDGQGDVIRDMMRRGVTAMYDFQDRIRGKRTASAQTMSEMDQWQRLDMLINGGVTEKYTKSKGYGSVGKNALHDVGAGDNHVIREATPPPAK